MLFAPNNSTPITVHANGVFVAAAKTAIKPRPANKSTGAPLSVAMVLPKAAPIKNKGVTSPPLKPDPKVIAVNNNFQNQPRYVAPPAEKDDTILTPPWGLVTPKPR